MLATMGYITPEITGKLPGYSSPSMGLKLADIPNGLAAISKVPSAGWVQILAYGAFCKLSQDQSPGTAASQGDFGFKVPHLPTRLRGRRVVGEAGEWAPSHHCDHRHVLPGCTGEQRVGRLGRSTRPRP